jgi:CBS domain containing-hemolysin-like protein
VYGQTPDDVIGVVLRRDILAATADGRGDTRVTELARPVHFVTDSAPLDELLRTLLEQRQHLVVAIDEHGGVAGVLTLEDVLEEILGEEIVDELDEVDDMREMARQRREKLLGTPQG